MTYEEILNRDVPQIKAQSQIYARNGICADIAIYYKKEAVTGISVTSDYSLENDGWKPAGISIPCNVPYTSYWSFLYQRLGSTPLFA